MKEQIVIRSYANHFLEGTEKLVCALNNGYRVVMGNPIGKDIEYILEKEVEDLPTGRSDGKWYATNRDDGGVNLSCSECGYNMGIKNGLRISKKLISYCSCCGSEMKNAKEIATL